MTPNFFFLNIKKDTKNAEFHPDFKSIEKVVKNAHKKSYKQNKFDEYKYKRKKCIFPSHFC